MRDLLTVILATAWVLEAIWLQRIRRHPYERPDHIDRDFREMVARYNHQVGERFLSSEWVGECPDHGPNCSRRQGAYGVIVHHGPPTSGQGRGMCPVHGWRCLGGH